MFQIGHLPIVALYGVALFIAWSVIGVLLTSAALTLPVLLGWWRLARAISVLLAFALLVLWILALFGIPTGLPLPSRPRAGKVVWPIVALWPALAAVIITRHRLATAPSVAPSDKGQA